DAEAGRIRCIRCTGGAGIAARGADGSAVAGPGAGAASASDRRGGRTFCTRASAAPLFADVLAGLPGRSDGESLRRGEAARQGGNRCGGWHWLAHLYRITGQDPPAPLSTGGAGSLLSARQFSPGAAG